MEVPTIDSDSKDRKRKACTLEHMEEMKLSRKQKNRVSASESRQRKKQFQASLEEKMQTLISENQQLQDEIERLKSEINDLESSTSFLPLSTFADPSDQALAYSTESLYDIPENTHLRATHKSAALVLSSLQPELALLCVFLPLFLLQTTFLTRLSCLLSREHQWTISPFSTTLKSSRAWTKTRIDYSAHYSGRARTLSYPWIEISS